MSAAAIAATAQASSPPPSAWKSPSGFGFHDLIDIVNPLQHLPIIGSIYRWVTGDRPGEAAQIAGDALYGGPIGVALGLVGAATEDKAGHDLGEQVLAGLFGSHDHGTAVAAATPAASAVPAPQSAKAGSAPTGATAAAATAASGLPTALFGGIALTHAETAAPTAAAVPDHAPMPLPGHAAALAAAGAQAPSAAQQFLARDAALQRQLSNGPRPIAQTAPIPLVLPAGTLPAGRPAVSVPVAPAAPTAVQEAPLDISQKMLDALDKYMKLEKDREKTAPAAAPAIDLSL